MQADRGAEQLDKLAGKLVRFPNIIDQELDISEFMDEEVIHRVKSADAYFDKLEELLFGDSEEQGDPMVWNSLHKKFELRQHEMTIWTGYKGHGKSALLSQQLVAMLKRGKKVFIISPEFRPERVLERMLFQFSGTRLLTETDLQDFLLMAARNLWLYDNQASLKPKEVIALCRYAGEKLTVDHVLIDSLMKCGIPPDDYAGQKTFVDKAQSVCHKYPFHLHLVAHARKDKDDGKPAGLHDVKGSSEIADMAENVVSVWRNKPKEKCSDGRENEPDAALTVEAQRNAEGWIGTVNLFFDPESILFYEPGYAPERNNRARF